MDFCRDSMVELASQVRSGKLSAREVVGHALERIEALNPVVNAFVAVDGDRALVEAAAVDSAVAAGRDPGPLAGIPFGVKDLEDAAGFVTTEGSLLFADEPPAEHDSILVARLKAAGAIVVGKTNTPELGHKGDTVQRAFRRDVESLEPRTQRRRVLWRDGGGDRSRHGSSRHRLGRRRFDTYSIFVLRAVRHEALARQGPFRGASSLRTGSTCRREGRWRGRIADVVAALDVAVGPDPSDLRSLPRPEASWPATLNDPKVPSRIAWSPTLGYAPLDDEVRAICTRAVRSSRITR